MPYKGCTNIERVYFADVESLLRACFTLLLQCMRHVACQRCLPFAIESVLEPNPYKLKHSSDEDTNSPGVLYVIYMHFDITLLHYLIVSDIYTRELLALRASMKRNMQLLIAKLTLSLRDTLHTAT